MALPIFAASLAGMILSSLTVFFATRIPVILTSLGLSVVVYAGLSVLAGQIVEGVQSAMSGAGSISYGGMAVNAMGILGAAGVWDAINIVLSGYVSIATIKASKLALTKLQS